jgi:hypothetical protein
MRSIVELIRLIILALFLPFILIIIGPLLVLAVWRGQQQMGPITLNSAQYGSAGRAGILVLGLAVWLLVWGGLAWLTVVALSAPLPFTMQIPSLNSLTALTLVTEPSPTSPPFATVIAADTITPAPTFSPTAASTPPPPTERPSPTPTRRLATAATTSTLTPTPTFDSQVTAITSTLELQLTPTIMAGQALITPTVISRPPTLTLTPAGQTTLTDTNELAAISAIKEADLLLQATIRLANKEDINNLSRVWEDKALIIIEDFETELFDQAARPFSLEFEYLLPPTASIRNFSDQATVTSHEKWSYRGPTRTHQEAFEFIYTLRRQGETWVATSFTYQSLPLPTPTMPDRLSTVTPGSSQN